MSLMGGSKDWDDLEIEAAKKKLVINMGEQIKKCPDQIHPFLIKIYEELCTLHDIHPVTKPKPTLEDYGRTFKIKL